MINKYGLYRNIVPRYEIAGLKSCINDNQTQGWWLPFMDNNGDIHLVDTYHITTGSIIDCCEPIESFIEFNKNNKDGTWLINKSNYYYHYGGSVKINVRTEKYFELVCDLREFTYLIGDQNDYKEEDIIRNVQLYCEHKYPNGITLVRKNTKKDINRQVENLCHKLINNVSFSWISENNITELDKYIQLKDEITQQNRTLLLATKEYIKKIKQAEELKEQARTEYLTKIL